MIVVKVEMWPGGDETKAREFGRAVITNTGEKTYESGGSYGDYTIALYGGAYGQQHYHPSGNPWRFSTLRHFDRVHLGMWDLMYQALKMIVGYRTEGRTKVKLPVRPHPDDELL